MENHHSRRYQPTRTPPSPSPRLSRSKSGTTPAISPSQRHTAASNPSPGSANHRSKSATKPRTNHNHNHIENKTSPSTIPKQNNPSFVNFLQRKDCKSTHHVVHNTRMNSPSAWALSPGRSPVAATPSSGTSGGGVSGVLKYFKQKKVSRAREEEMHRFRILHNRLLQWRFGNARAEGAMARVKVAAEEKMFNVWLRILKSRNSILQKRIEMQIMKNEIKLYNIMYPQVCLLKEWERIERRNSEAVGRVARKLSAISVSLPLIHDAKVDMVFLNDAMSMAMDVIDSTEATIANIFSQVERTCYLLTEFTVLVKQQKEYMEELEKRIVMVASLEAEEKSLRAHLIQLAS